MAITYENVIYDRIITGLHTLIADEFSIPIYFDEHESNQSFLITPGEDSLIELMSNGQTRNYAVNISYQLQSGGNYTKNSVKQVTEIAERIKRLIHNNTAYSPSSSYKWHDGRCEMVEYSRDPDDPSLLNAVLQFNCASMETL
jgi:hypothetical protein|tara:strand:- start:274 stop:702 length:429 start_codon:yes stop_codon:yes gene_type:complete